MSTPVSDIPTERLTDRYNREAHAYHELWGPILRIAGLRLLRELANTTVQRIVDIGTGVGLLLPDLGEAFPGALVLGVDRASGMLKLAPKGTPLAVMDARQLALPPKSVDLVLLIFMLFHLDQPLDGLREAHRVLRRRGRVGTVTWAEISNQRQPKSGRNVWTSTVPPRLTRPRRRRHTSVDTPEKMETLLRSAGFSSLHSWGEDLVTTMDFKHLLRLRTSIGSRAQS